MIQVSHCLLFAIDDLVKLNPFDGDVEAFPLAGENSCVRAFSQHRLSIHFKCLSHVVGTKTSYHLADSRVCLELYNVPFYCVNKVSISNIKGVAQGNFLHRDYLNCYLSMNFYVDCNDQNMLYLMTKPHKKRIIMHNSYKKIN